MAFIWKTSFVRVEHRGVGIGTALLRHLARLAVERDCARFEWAALDWNEPALRVYRGIGAKSMDEWQTFRLEGEVHQCLKVGLIEFAKAEG